MHTHFRHHLKPFRLLHFPQSLSFLSLVFCSHFLLQSIWLICKSIPFSAYSTNLHIIYYALHFSLETGSLMTLELGQQETVVLFCSFPQNTGDTDMNNYVQPFTWVLRIWNRNSCSIPWDALPHPHHLSLRMLMRKKKWEGENLGSSLTSQHSWNCGIRVQWDTLGKKGGRPLRKQLNIDLHVNLHACGHIHTNKNINRMYYTTHITQHIHF